MSDTRIIVTNDRNHKIVRVNNFLISYGINNSGLFNNNNNDNNNADNNVNREPTIDEYHELWNITDEYFEQYFYELSNKTNKMSGHETNFVKFESTIKSASYCTDNIPNDKYQICIKYSFSDMYYTNNSQLTDEMEVMAEGISKLIFVFIIVRRKKYIGSLFVGMCDDIYPFLYN